MALLMYKVEPYIIRMVKIWWSNMMFCYLNKTDKTFTGVLDICMFQQSSYALIPPNHSRY